MTAGSTTNNGNGLTHDARGFQSPLGCTRISQDSFQLIQIYIN